MAFGSASTTFACSLIASFLAMYISVLGNRVRRRPFSGAACHPAT
jgi:hypothetical protein